MRDILLLSSLLLLQSAPGAPEAAEAQAPASDELALELALEAVKPHRLRADLAFLASDELKGRDTPSPELRIAAMFLRSRVDRLGFTPGAEDGWFYDFPLHSANFSADDSSLEVSSALGQGRFEFGKDYFFLRGSHVFDSSLSSGVVCVGSASKDDIEGIDVAGRWALVLETGRVLRKAIERAEEAGAAGVLVTPGPDYDMDKRGPYLEKYGKRAGEMAGPGTPSLKEREAEGGLPVVMLSREAVARLYELSEAPWEGDDPPLGHDLKLRVQEERVRESKKTWVSNVCAFWPGSDPVLSKEVMIVSAHYDHVGVMRGEIHNGADDNASGTTGLLGVAEALTHYGPMKRSVLLMWVSGEEKGLWGSKVWTENPWLPADCHAVLDINIDMIGRTETDELYITPSRDHDAFNSLAQAAYGLATVEGFAELESQDEYWRRSDHMNFNDNLEIPVTFLSTGNHPDYHKPTDTSEKIDYEKMSRVVRLVVRLLDKVQAAELTR